MAGISVLLRSVSIAENENNSKFYDCVRIWNKGFLCDVFQENV